MKDFAIEPQRNGFIRERNGMRFTNNYPEYMAQKVRTAISLFLGEWYLNKNIGIPYIPSSLEKIDHQPLLETALQVTISGVNGIEKLLSFNPSFDMKERKLKIRFVAQCENGNTLEMNEDIPVQRMGA
jgi:hypothetical protein